VKALRSVRGRVAALATLAVAAVLLVVGTVVVATFAQRERDRFDERLAEPSPRSLGRALAEGRLPKSVLGAPPVPPADPDQRSARATRGSEHEGRKGPGEHDGRPNADGSGREAGEVGESDGGRGPDNGLEPEVRPSPDVELAPRPPAPPELGGRVLRPEGEFVRLIAGDRSVAAVDAPAELPLPDQPGYRTVEVDGTVYRSLVRVTPEGDVLEVGGELSGVEERVGSLRARVLIVSLIGIAVVGALAWWLAGIALRPLGGLRNAVSRVSTTQDLSKRLPADSRLEEIDALSEGVNAMLARLERSSTETEDALEATRRFTADAGHELRTPLTALRANLGALLRNPRLGEPERRAALGEAEAEAARTVRLLDALQTLARGDAGTALPREQVDLGDVVDASLERARRRHPEVGFRLRGGADTAVIEGWPDGLQVLVDNLLENAARHGRPGGHVEVALEPAGAGVVLTVDDDGPGVPREDSERIFERFARGNGAGQGSGLGLALVRQQARLHGGDASVGESQLGGARFAVRLATGSATGGLP
jgi:two-component system sensor histidine kinase PrrB